MSNVTNIKTRKAYVETPRQQFLREAQKHNAQAQANLQSQLARLAIAKKRVKGSLSSAFWAVIGLGFLFFLFK